MFVSHDIDRTDLFSRLNRPLRYCPTCGQARKDHTFPMLDACERKEAEHDAKGRGFKPWMLDVLGQLGEAAS